MGIDMQHWRKSSIENMGPEELESRGLKRFGWFRKKAMNALSNLKVLVRILYENGFSITSFWENSLKMDT